MNHGKHEWHPENSDVEIDEYVYVYFHCNYAEVTDSFTDSKRDEVYYEYGAECEAQKTVTYDYDIYDSNGQFVDPTEKYDEEVYYAFSNNHDAVAERFANLSPHEPADSLEMAIELGEDNTYVSEQEYRVVFTKEGSDVSEF